MTHIRILAIISSLCVISSLAFALPKNDLKKGDVTIKETLSAEDIKRIVEITKYMRKTFDRTEADAPGIDVAKGTVQITNADKSERDSYVEMKVLGEDQDYPRFLKFCDTKLKFVIDAAVFKGMKDIGPIASFHGQVIEGLWTACSQDSTGNAAKAFIAKIKTLHFTLGAAECQTQPYAKAYPTFTYALDAKSGIMTIGLCPIGGTNIADSVLSWVAQQ